jgi:tetratricopeptide (TPR) repeat protein
MKIVQKILSHGLLIAFFVAVFFVYLYRGDLFPQWFDKQAQTEATPSQSATAQSPVVSADEPQAVQASGTDDEGQAVAFESTEPALEAVEQPIVTEPLSAAEPAATAAQYRPVGPEEAAKQTYNPVAEAPASVTTAPEYRPLEAKKTAPPGATAEPAEPAAVPADSGVASESDFQSQLEQARQHYWRRDMPAAEQAYRRLTESHPERAAVWGELGNLFFSQREMVQATDAYYRAIELLIEQGDAERARQLLGTMYQLDAEKANELETRLRQAGR